jgi:FkbM family methyltransferase
MVKLQLRGNKGRQDREIIPHHIIVSAESPSGKTFLSRCSVRIFLVFFALVFIHLEISRHCKATQSTSNKTQSSDVASSTSTQDNTPATPFSKAASTAPATRFQSGCTPLQNRLIQKALPDSKTIIDATKCPDSSAWLSSYLEEASDTEPFVFLNVGCNKGYDSIAVARTISRNTEVFDKQKWANAIGIAHPGNCFQARNSEAAMEPSRPKTAVEIYCIEAMPQTVDRLIRAAVTTKAKANGLHVYNYAMVGKTGGAPILFPNPEGDVGKEHLGIGHCTQEAYKSKCKEVPTSTLDEFVKEHVDNHATPNRRFPFVSIDVEGFDYTVMLGAQETIKRTDYLEFEYHGIGDWLGQKLKDAVDMLTEHGLVCYWSGVNQLWKLSDTCWIHHFEFHMWSNIACVAPKYKPKLAERMEQVFEDTLVQGIPTTK